jgi:chitin disaccharide deacetylase
MEPLTSRRLWLNADDLGLTPGVSAGICAALERSPAATTTAMVCAEGALATVGRFAPRLAGRIGLHLQLTDGVPRLPAARVPSLVGADGRFPRNLPLPAALDLGEVEREWEAQLAALRGLGIAPTHLDSHHHVHQLPGVFPVYAELARRHRLPARGGGPEHQAALRRQGVPTSDVFTTAFYRAPLDVDHLLAVVTRLCPPGGTIEVMTHPGEVDPALRRRSTYVEQRARELATLCAPELTARLREAGIVRIGPAELL